MREGAFALLGALAIVRPASATDDAVCGAFAFPLLPDSLYVQAAPRHRPARGPFKVGDREQLYIYNYTDGKYELIAFTYRAVNVHSYILVDDRYWSLADPRLIAPNDVARLSEVFETNAGPPPGLRKGIYEIETSTYAPVTPAPDGVVSPDPMVYIAVTEIKSSLADEYIVGYVTPGDRLTKDRYQYSNERNLVVLDAASRTSDARRERTLAHEFLHVIHRGVDPGEHRWVDEGIAVYSQTICGYEGNTGDDFFENPNIGLFDDGSQPTVADYDKAYLLMLYMADQYGAQLLGDIVRSKLRGIAGIDSALARVGSTDRFTGGVFTAWTVANLSGPHPTSRYAYRAYDPRPHHPPSFGDAGPLPVREQGSLVAYGLRYIRAGAREVAGEFAGSEIPVWSVVSVEEANGERSPRRWFQSDLGHFRDCSLHSPWLVVTPLAIPGGQHPYVLDWHAPTDGPNPVIVKQEPVGAEVLPYGGHIRGEFGNVDPGQEITVAVSSRGRGILARDVRVIRYGLQGRCGEVVVIVDSSSGPLPGDDLITVRVSDLYSPLGGALPSTQASWTFGTGAPDTIPPVVTIGLLANPVLPSYVAAVVYSNETLYPDGDGPVRLVVNGGITVALQPQDGTKKGWIGTLALPQTGQYDFVLHATDLAGNRPAQPRATYALIVEDGSPQRARVALSDGNGSAEIVVQPGTIADGGVLFVRFDENAMLFGPEGSIWLRRVRVGLSPRHGERANSLRDQADGLLTPLTRGDDGLLWAAIEKPGRYSLVEAPVRPVGFSLGQNRPNPFNPATHIPVGVPPSYEAARLTIYAMSGQLVRSFEVPPGYSTITWDGCDASGRPAASGVYLAELTGQEPEAQARRRAIRMVLLR